MKIFAKDIASFDVFIVDSLFKLVSKPESLFQIRRSFLCFLNAYESTNKCKDFWTGGLLII